MTADERRYADRCRELLQAVSVGIGERTTERPAALDAAASLVEGAFAGAGLAPGRHNYTVAGATVANIEAQTTGSGGGDVVLLAANYDSMRGSPGANTNASGLAALIVLAEVLARESGTRPVRFVAFVNKEPPHFQTDAMGSVQYARRSRERGERFAAVLNLQTLGYYTGARGSQKYPSPLSWIYPDTGDFLAFVGNLESRGLLRAVIRDFRAAATLASVGAVLPAALPGVGWSDHWSFWEAGYPAVMVSDTAMFRDPLFGTADDTPTRLSTDAMARAVTGLLAVVRKLRQ